MSVVMRWAGIILPGRTYLDIEADVRGWNVEAGVYGRMASNSAVSPTLPNLSGAPRSRRSASAEASNECAYNQGPTDQRYQKHWGIHLGGLWLFSLCATGRVRSSWSSHREGRGFWLDVVDDKRG
jgi:hypothetical protein